MIKNYKITAYLCSPLAGEPPKLDAILQWELSCRMGMKAGKKLLRSDDFDEVPIPLAKRTIDGIDINCCSDPIMPNPAAEWVDMLAKRFDTSSKSLIVEEKERKSINMGGGALKQQFLPIRVRNLACVCWFFRGDKKPIKKLIKNIHAIGQFRRIGYGLVSEWAIEEVDNDYSIFANGILMKTLPYSEKIKDTEGSMITYGSSLPPYWHPKNYGKILVPC